MKWLVTPNSRLPVNGLALDRLRAGVSGSISEMLKTIRLGEQHDKLRFCRDA